MRITKINDHIPMDLFLLADPAEKSILGYLPDSLVYIAKIKEETVGGYILQPLGPGKYELKNIAVMPGYQNQGIGGELLRHLFGVVKELNGESIEVGTGTFGYQLSFYQRAGFRADRIDKDFFLQNYKEAIFENGIQHKDMLRLLIKL